MLVLFRTVRDRPLQALWEPGPGVESCDCRAARWIFSASRHAGKLYSGPYTWRCGRARDDDVCVIARQPIGI